MPRQVTLTVYTLDELKDDHPSGYAIVLERWKQEVDELGESPCQREIIESLEAVVKACSANIIECSVGAYSSPVLTTDAEPHDAEWFRTNVLAPLGYVRVYDDKVSFPGLCALTGYSSDDNLLEALWEDLSLGINLSHALSRLVVIVKEMVLDDFEELRSSDGMEDSYYGDQDYDKFGNIVH